jgi:hypothetical protein
MFLKLFLNNQRKAMLPNSFYKNSITLIPKSGKDTSKQIYEPISLMNIDPKVHNKIFAN